MGSQYTGASRFDQRAAEVLLSPLQHHHTSRPAAVCVTLLHLTPPLPAPMTHRPTGYGVYPNEQTCCAPGGAHCGRSARRRAAYAMMRANLPHACVLGDAVCNGGLGERQGPRVSSCTSSRSALLLRTCQLTASHVPSLRPRRRVPRGLRDQPDPEPRALLGGEAPPALCC
jgi:hypothetical protein